MTINAFFAETQVSRRLSLGVLPVDALSASDLHVPVNIELENNIQGKMLRHKSGRFSFSYFAGQSSQLRFRVFDNYRQFIPRRFVAPLLSLNELLNIEETQAPLYLNNRVRHIHMFAGAAYPIVSRSTGIRGRVIQAGNIVRWAIIELRANSGSGSVLARARSDDRGEFLLVVPPNAVPDLSIPNTISLFLRVYARAAALSTTGNNADPLWDVPLETITQPEADDPVSTGRQVPVDYVASQNDVPISLVPSQMSGSAQLGDIVFSPP